MLPPWVRRDLVAREQHRRAHRKQGEREEVLHLAVAQPLDRRIVGRALDAAVPAAVVVGAVAIPLPVRLVVLDVVGDEVVQREAVVAGDEVDALLGLAALVLVHVRAADQPAGERADRPVVALEEAAHVVAEPAVPFLPALAGEAPDLVEAGRVPGFRDQLDVREHRVRLDVPQHRRRGHRAALAVAREDRGEVEAEAVDVHLAHPVAEAVEDQAPDDRLVRVERVAAAGVVGVLGAVVAEDVVGVVGEPAERERRPVGAAFGGVVVDDVEDHLDPGAVQRLHHVAELVEHARSDRRAAL